MKVLLITEFFPDIKKKNFLGGVETRTFYVAKYLALRNQVYVISRRKNREKKIEKYKNLKIIRLGTQTSDIEAKFKTILPRLKFIIQAIYYGLKIKPDLVEGSNFISLPSAWFIGKIKGIPCLAWYPDLYGFEWLRNFDFITGLFGLLLEKFCLKLNWTQIIALSKQTKNKLIKSGIPKKNIKIIYGGVDIDFISKIKVKKTKFPSICCISRLVPYKNVDCLLKAVSQIKNNFHGLKCVIVGKGQEKNKLLKMANSLGLSENVEFQQELTYLKLIKILKSSWVFCLPSTIEGFGLTTIEAAAAKTPFIIADININREVTNNLGGLYFKPKNCLDLAKKINFLLSNNLKRKELAEQGKKLIRMYRWSKIASETEEIYKKSLFK